MPTRAALPVLAFALAPALAAAGAGCGRHSADAAKAREAAGCEGPAVERTAFRSRLSGRGSPVHGANDVVVAVGEPFEVRAKLSYGPTWKDLEGEDATLVTGEGPCGPWTVEATVRTDGDGWARFARPPFATPGVRPFHVVVAGDGTRASGAIWTVAPGTPAVLFDIDGTLTTSDAELIEDLVGDGAPNVRPGAPDVARRWRDLGHLVVYVTGRPYQLRARSRAWLESHGFPPGPLFTVEATGEAVPRRAGVGEFKRKRLLELIGAGLDVRAAYGNASTDVCAYAEAGIDPARTWITQRRDPCPGFAAFHDLPSYVDHLATLPAPP